MLNTSFSPWPSFTQEEADSVQQVLLSNKVNYWTGQECRQFEKEFSEWADSSYAVALANGTLALDLALKALGIGLGDEVITTPRTFLASASSIVTAGAQPVFADVDLKTGDIYVAWTDEAGDSVGGGTGVAAQNHAWIQVAKSSDAGGTWTVLPHPHDTSDSISGSPIDRFHPWMDVSEDGVVHIIDYDTRHSVNRTGVDLYYTFSTDGGSTWETEQRFSTETSDNLADGQECIAWFEEGAAPPGFEDLGACVIPS